MDDEAGEAWDRVVDALTQDEDDDVTAAGEALHVRGSLFAFIQDDELVVDIPAARAGDLVERGIAHAVDVDERAAGRWVAVTDTEDWLELASESHQFVGEPAVGGDS
jgi:hypothetical protein